MDPDVVLRMAAPIIALGATAMSFRAVRRMGHTFGLMNEYVEVAYDQLEQMELARDPGRDVQDRLAHTLEARLIATRGPKVEPAERRAVAQMMAAQIIDDLRRADLLVVSSEDPG